MVTQEGVELRLRHWNPSHPALAMIELTRRRDRLVVGLALDIDDLDGVLVSDPLRSQASVI